MLTPKFELEIAVGFATVVILASLLNKLGDILFSRGIARPFFVRGHRVHHRDILILTLPATYALIVSMMVIGVVRVDWAAFWTGIETTLVITACCLFVDLSFDRLSLGMRERAWLHHELIYLLVPAYFFTHVITLFV